MKLPHVTHELKSWPEPFHMVVSGLKTCEVRHDDRGFNVGDVLHLREWNPNLKSYTGSSLRVLVTHIERGPEWGLPQGMVAMSVRRVS